MKVRGPDGTFPQAVLGEVGIQHRPAPGGAGTGNTTTGAAQLAGHRAMGMNGPRRTGRLQLFRWR